MLDVRISSIQRPKATSFEAQRRPLENIVSGNECSFGFGYQLVTCLVAHGS